MGRRYALAKKLTVFILFFIVLVFALVKAQKFLAPLFLAALLSYLLFPIANFLEKRGVPRILANLTSILVAIFTLWGVIHFFSNQFTVFVDDFPQIRAQATQNIRTVQTWLADRFDVSNRTVKEWFEERINDLAYVEGTIRTVFNTTTSMVINAGLTPVYIFFMLYYRTKFYDFILMLTPDDKERRAEKILGEVNLVTSKYMSGVFTVVLILAVVHSVAFSIMGLRYPIMLGVTAAFFNLIPYFGTLIGALVPLLFSLVAMDSLDYALWVVIYFLIIQFVENNILTPNITGGYVSLNPFVTILSLIVGSMIWGVVGMFIIIPFVAMFRIFCAHIPSLEPVAFLLSDRGTEEHALTWDKVKSVFKKT